MGFKIRQNVDPNGDSHNAPETPDRLERGVPLPILHPLGSVLPTLVFATQRLNLVGDCPQIFHSAPQLGGGRHYPQYFTQHLNLMGALSPNISLSASIWWGHCPQIFLRRTATNTLELTN